MSCLEIEGSKCLVYSVCHQQYNNIYRYLDREMMDYVHNHLVLSNHTHTYNLNLVTITLTSPPQFSIVN